MIRTTILACALAAGAARAQAQAEAEAEARTCSDRETMVRHLAEGWGESRRSVALDAGNSIVELFASPQTGTWTLTVTRPGGPTCMLASGHAFETLDDPLPVLDEGA